MRHAHVQDGTSLGEAWCVARRQTRHGTIGATGARRGSTEEDSAMAACRATGSEMMAVFTRRRSSSYTIGGLTIWPVGRSRSTLARTWWALPTAGFGLSAAALAGAYLFTRRRDGRQSPTTSGRLSATTRTIVVNREPADVYQFWLRFDQFPRFMRHLKQVSIRKDGTSHWKAYGPGGQLYEWDAEIVQDRPNELIAWQSRPGGDVQNEGSVRFERAPGGRGTLVRVNLRYDPPAGAAGSAIARLLGREPGQEVQEDLRRFKQVIETGEVVLSDASIHRRAHPARPDEASFRLPTPVPGAGPVESEHDDARDSRTWPEPDDRPAYRADADADVAEPIRGGTR